MLKPTLTDNAGNQYHEMLITPDTSVRVTRIPRIFDGTPGFRVSRVTNGDVSDGLEIPENKIFEFLWSVLHLVGPQNRATQNTLTQS
jgi:hypothetical protein